MYNMNRNHHRLHCHTHTADWIWVNKLKSVKLSLMYSLSKQLFLLYEIHWTKKNMSIRQLAQMGKQHSSF